MLPTTSQHTSQYCHGYVGRHNVQHKHKFRPAYVSATFGTMMPGESTRNTAGSKDTCGPFAPTVATKRYVDIEQSPTASTLA